MAATQLAPLPAAQAQAASAETHALAVPIDAGGHRWTLPGHVCLPVGAAHAPLVVINHGSWSDRSGRLDTVALPCASATAGWFLQRGFAVAAAVRTGYGPGDSPWTEDFTCTPAGFRHAGLETARQIDAIVETARSVPGVDRDRVVVIGHSGGGWGGLAYASQRHPGVIAQVNFAGGRGGHYRLRPNNNCHPEHLVAAAATFGHTAATSMLWIYAQNDTFFAPELARALAQAFNAAGGQAQLVITPSSGDDGHGLFYDNDGAALWGPPLENYLKAQGAWPAP